MADLHWGRFGKHPPGAAVNDPGIAAILERKLAIMRG
jgi:hypothetical protein